MEQNKSSIHAHLKPTLIYCGLDVIINLVDYISATTSSLLFSEACFLSFKLHCFKILKRNDTKFYSRKSQLPEIADSTGSGNSIVFWKIKSSVLDILTYALCANDTIFAINIAIFHNFAINIAIFQHFAINWNFSTFLQYNCNYLSNLQYNCNYLSNLQYNCNYLFICNYILQLRNCN